MEGFIEVNEISDFVSYIRSIEWRDPWLIALLSFHILVTFMCFSTRNYGNFQVMLFITLLLLVYFSESINEVAARNWALFSRQQYFDSKGLFISVVFSIPILLNCMIMVGSWLYQSTQIMTNIKKAQLRQRLKELNINREQQKHIKAD
ncbi:transmembrane protein 18 [Leguminivora glycinivorella]|uniref:transmembrane protein 18 n=1 Tax=Leguminivora glycinivorella TaxID=1035111 RepID=UPI00200E546A|nr:transmembrane protein 18 [Leguminivora glycinivorella]